MKVNEYRKQAEQQVEQNGTNLYGEINKIVGKMSDEEMVNIGIELNHRRLTKTAQRISTDVGHEQRMSRSAAEAIVASEIMAATSEA